MLPIDVFICYHEHMNELSPYDFDQSDKGWRLLDTRHKFLEAAKLIENYIKTNEELIKNQSLVSVQTMYFHAGQEYAMIGPEYYDKAVKNFSNSYKSTTGWNTYVDGTIAFLNKDRAILKKAMTELQELANNDSKFQPNATLLNDFHKGLTTDKSYGFIYDNS